MGGEEEEDREREREGGREAKSPILSLSLSLSLAALLVRSARWLFPEWENERKRDRHQLNCRDATLTHYSAQLGNQP